MGRADIARFLLENNARWISRGWMLGRLDIIKAAAAAFPNIVRVPVLIKSAHRARGKRAREAVAVVEFRKSLPS